MLFRSVLVAERKSLWSKSRSVTEPEKMAEIKEQIAKCSERLKEIRWEVKHCDEIAQRSGVIESNLKQVEQDYEKQTQGKEKNKDESFRRRR